MKNTLLLLSLLLAGKSLLSQPLQTLYYENGKKRLEGRVTFLRATGPALNSFEVQRVPLYTPRNEGLEVPDVVEKIERGSTSGYIPDPAQNMGVYFEGLVTHWPETGKGYFQMTYKAGLPQGPFTEYYAPGQVLQKGLLQNNMANGPWIYYYKNGKPFYTGSYKPYSQKQLIEFWYEDRTEEGILKNKMRNTGTPHKREKVMEDRSYWAGQPFNRLLLEGSAKEGLFTFWRESGAKWAEGTYRNDLPDGIWKIWRADPKVPYAIITFDQGLMKEVTNGTGGTKLESDGSGGLHHWNPKPPIKNEVLLTEEDFAGAGLATPETVSGIMTEPPPPQQPTIFTFVDEMPDFPGDIKAWISKNLRYPPAAKEARLEGRVVVKFMVNEDGSITNAVVEKGVDAQLDAEALRLVKAMPKWEPAKQNGKPVKFYFRVPVKFILN